MEYGSILGILSTDLVIEGGFSNLALICKVVEKKINMVWINCGYIEY